MTPENLTARADISSYVVGKFCIARGHGCGVHAGEVLAVDGDRVVLANSRRLWEWMTPTGVALSGVAQFGLIYASSKIDAKNPIIYLTDICELIPCSDLARESINDAPTPTGNNPRR